MTTVIPTATTSEATTPTANARALHFEGTGLAHIFTLDGRSYYICEPGYPGELRDAKGLNERMFYPDCAPKECDPGKYPFEAFRKEVHADYQVGQLLRCFQNTMDPDLSEQVKKHNREAAIGILGNDDIFERMLQGSENSPYRHENKDFKSIPPKDRFEKLLEILMEHD
jgi:hypothetical protein